MLAILVSPNFDVLSCLDEIQPTGPHSCIGESTLYLPHLAIVIILNFVDVKPNFAQSV